MTKDVYVDGSALSRFVLDVPGAPEWQAWAAAQRARLVVSPLTVTELRRVTDPLGAPVRAAAAAIVDELRVVRFSDQALELASHVTGVLTPFAGLHLGMAVAEPDVGAIATYDPLLAQVAHLYQLEVCTPGREDDWWIRQVPPGR